MKITLVFLITLLVVGLSHAGELSCIPRAEMGETTTGQHLYERDEDLQIQNLSRINLDELIITSAEGKLSKIVKVEKNVYKLAGAGTPYYFITNDSGTILTELSVQESATYVKVLMCK
jgi:hypothetical protein